MDAIISTIQEKELEADSGFCDAVEASNAELAARGLYITHLLSEREMFLRRDWLDQILAVTRLQLRHLELFRPATVDLVLSKMMRGSDPQKMADAEFMIHLDGIGEAQLLEAFAQMTPIELVELREAFAKARPIVSKFARAEAGTAELKQSSA